MQEESSATKSHRWTLYVSPTLIEQFRSLAAQHRRSLNSELVWALEQYVRAEKRKGQRDVDPQGV